MSVALMTPSGLLDRLPPHDRDAERGLLGGLLRDPEALGTVSLSEADFYFDAHRKIFRVLIDLANSGAPVDLVGVFNLLRQRKQLEDVGGHVYLTELWEAVPTAANASYHTKLIRDAAITRSLIHAANEILRDCYDRAYQPAELLSSAERRIFEIGMQSDRGKDSVRVIGDVLADVLHNLDERIGSGSAMSGIPTGYPDLDRLLGGLKPGELFVVGARPSIGKTAIALNFAANAAGEGTAVLLFSLEMASKEIAERLLSMSSGVPMHHLSRAKGLTPPEITSITHAASRAGIGGCAIYLDDAPGTTVSRIASTARRVVRKAAVQLVVVDYLQLIGTEGRRDTRVLDVADQTRRLKLLARELGVPVVLLSQLSRENEKSDRRPRLSDLRDSGSIEQDADRVILLYRENGLSPDRPDWPTEIIVAKNRNGPTGTVVLDYVRPVMRFENHAPGG